MFTDRLICFWQIQWWQKWRSASRTIEPSDNEIIPTGDCIYDRNDLLAVTIDGHLCLGKVAERMYESSQCYYIEKKMDSLSNKN